MMNKQQHQVWKKNEIRQLFKRVRTVHAFRAITYTKTSARVSMTQIY